MGKDLGRRFRDDEDGLALTEYLILLGLLTGAVIVAVTTFGTDLSDAWQGWADWIAGTDVQAPEPGTPPHLLITS
ncbi:MAG: Flp family type IVb pilin [Roseovarius sp.]|nr:Flp family type IVb pilin [Roseovarius sp.]